MQKIQNQIDKEKCSKWSDMLIELMKKAKELNSNEKRYIKATFSIAFGQLELQEAIKEKNYKRGF